MAKEPHCTFLNDKQFIDGPQRVTLCVIDAIQTGPTIGQRGGRVAPTHIIRRVPRFLTLDDFKGVTASVLAEQPKGADFTGPDVVAIVTEDPEYQTLCDGLWDSLRLAFAVRSTTSP